jgi:D-beta-D-heptose 7-phosphate kinase/D-beta-D-heptose 1-phosphate adenosyltransferase
MTVVRGVAPGHGPASASVRIDPARASELVDRFSDQRVLLVGDLMLDRFIVGRVTRISPEAPVPVVRFQSQHSRLGGAANVANNIAMLGGVVSLVGVVGADATGEQLVSQLHAGGVDVSGVLVDSARPTTEKVRVVTERNQQVARIDYEHDGDLAGPAESALLERLRRAGDGVAAVLVSDYLKGTVTAGVMEQVRTIAGGRIPLLVDPKIPHLPSYVATTLITPNNDEAEAATQRRIRTDDDARDAAREFRIRSASEAVLMTRGEQGMWLSSDAVDLGIPAIAREVADVTGAGDTVVAVLALAMAAGASLLEASILSNHAAGIVVGKFGPATVTRDELLESVARDLDH